MSKEAPEGEDHQYDKQAKTEAQVQPVVLSSHEQQAAVFTTIYHHLLIHTTHEVEGRLKGEMIEENNVLRGMLQQLAVSLGKDHEQPPLYWLYVGVTDLIPQETLHEWANPPENPHWTEEPFLQMARYFEREKYKAGTD